MADSVATDTVSKIKVEDEEDVAIVDETVEVLPCGLLFHERYPWESPIYRESVRDIDLNFQMREINLFYPFSLTIITFYFFFFSE
jgi:hypothetical protein